MNEKHQNVIIRNANVSDLDAIVAIEQASSKNPWTREQFARELENSNAVFLVVVSAQGELDCEQNAGEVVGFVCAQHVIDNLEILEFAIHPHHRKIGLGTLLLERLFALADEKKIRQIQLEARESNHPAIALYEKCGFVKDGVRKKYYQNGEHAVLMSR